MHIYNYIIIYMWNCLHYFLQSKLPVSIRYLVLGEIDTRLVEPLNLAINVITAYQIVIHIISRIVTPQFLISI